MPANRSEPSESLPRRYNGKAYLIPIIDRGNPYRYGFCVFCRYLPFGAREMPAEPLLTIGEIAARARHLASDPYAFTERARHWAKLGVLRAVDQVGQGSGKHALFPETEAFMAAVANAFAEAGLPPAASRPVADAQGMARQALARWQGEKAKGRPRPMFVEIRFYPGGRSALGVHRGRWEQNADYGDAAEPRPMTSIKIDLGQLFTSVFEATKASRESEGRGTGVE